MTAWTLVALLRHAWTRHRMALAPIAAAACLFEFLLTRMAPEPHEVSWMSGLITAIPPEIRRLLGNDVATSPAGFLALGYVHPFFIVLLGTWIVRTSSASFAGEIGLGTMDLLASRPVPRWQFVAAGAITIAAGLAAILAAAWSGTAVGLHVRSLGVAGADFGPVVLDAWLLFAAWGAVGLLVGSTRRDGGQAIAWTTALLAGAFVLDYLARLWAPMAAARPFSLFRYYEPQAILAGGLPARSVLVLAATAVASLAASVVVVDRRNL